MTYTYQGDGLLSTKQSGNGTLTYAYDSNHRLLSVTGGGKTTAFTYDTDPNSQLTAQNAWGRMTTASNDGYTWHFSYDNMGRVNQQTLQTPNAWTHATYAYDADGRLATVGYPGDLASTISGMQAVNPCQYSYTILGRATGYQCWGPDGQQWLGLAHDATYNAAGQILGWSETSFTWNGSNAYWNYPYNLSRTYDPARGWITDMGESGWYPSSMSLHYNYQANGQLASEVNSSSGGSVTTSYTYDNLNRLATAGTGTWNMTFAYDEFGNRTSQTGSGGAPVSVLTYDSGTNRINSAGYSYDGAGNLTAMPLPQGASMGLTYDVFDRLVEADTHPASGQTTTSTMAYDAFGRRIAKTSLGAVYFYDASGRQLTSYLGTFVNGVYYYFAGQRLYNWTDRQGSLKGFYGTTSYYPYGEDVGTSTGNDNYKFAQAYRDSDSGLDYATERYLSSGIGRFLTPDRVAAGDPTQPQSLNGYGYANGDPVNGVDPSGRDTCLLNGTSSECGFVWNSVCSGSASLVDTNEPLTQVLCDFQFGVVAGAYNAVNAINNAIASAGPAPPSCSIAAYDRPIEATHGVPVPGAKHGYIEFTDQNGDPPEIAEGYKNGKYLNAQFVSAGAALPGDSITNSPDGSVLSGSDVCALQNILSQDVGTINSAPPIKYHWYGPNSSSVFGYMLNSLNKGADAAVAAWLQGVFANLPFMVGLTTPLPGVPNP